MTEGILNQVLLRITVFVLLALTSCRTRQAPTPDPALAIAARDSTIRKYLRSSGLDRPDISIEMRADRTSVVPGDTVRFTLIARNVGSTRVQVGAQCGPAMDIRISPPTGAAVSVLNAQFQDEKIPVAFTCELAPYHFAEPRDSLLNRLWWKASTIRGVYVAVAGARGAIGLDDVSAPLSIRVR
jgi:hypothetical protein